MKQTRARILSLLLALTMCLSLLPGTALADNVIPDSDSAWTDEITVGNQNMIHIFNGVNAPATADHPESQSLARSDKYINWYTVPVTYAPDNDTLPPEPSRTENASFTITLSLEYPNGTSTSETIPVLVYTQTWPSTANVTDHYPTRFSTDATNYEGFTSYQLQQPGESFTGYVFDGWYVGDKLQNLEAFISAQSIPGTDITYVARWKSDGSLAPETSKSREVWFNPNGGAAAKPSGYEYSDQTLNGATLSAMTDNDCKLLVLPSATREGYTFDGWYTAQTGGTKVSANMDLSPYQGNGGNNWDDDQIVLWAHWAEVKIGPHTVTFNWNGAEGISGADPIKVEHGKPIQATYSYSGRYAGIHTFKGWAMENGTVYTNQPVIADMTLYAIWEPELKGIDPTVEDTFQFSNNSSAFNSYTISERYLKLLLQGESASWQEYIRNYMKSPWSGSCFGMSAVYAMSHGGQIDLSLYQSGAKRLWDLDKPKDRAGVQDLINYYMLAQLTTPSQNYKWSYLPLNTTSRYQKIVQDLQGERGFSVLSFYFGANSGHAIVVKSIAKGSDGDYHISIWDPNNPMAEGELIISSNFSRAYFTNTTPNSTSYNINTDLKFIMPLSTKNQSYDARSLTSSSSVSVAGLTAILAADTGSFTLTAADGRSATVVNGRQIDGDLTLVPVAIATGENDIYQFYLDKGALNGLTVSISDGAGQVEMVSDDILVRVIASGLESVKVDKDSVSTVTATAVQQKITLISDELGGYWDKVIVSGKDTAIGLNAKAGKLTVSAANSAAVTVQRENVVKQTSGSNENVSATPEGVTISMDGQSADPTPTPTPTPAINPFTDVSPLDYYYDAVLWAVENGVTAGTGDGTTFSPGDPCTRAQIVTFLWRAYGKQKPTATENPFTDVKADDYYYEAVLWAVEKGVTAGTGDGTTFSPNDPCTRAQAVTFQWRAAGKPTASGTSSFTDVDSGSYYAGAVAWAVENKITAGATTTTFDPNGTCTRGQIVTFLYREMGK